MKHVDGTLYLVSCEDGAGEVRNAEFFAETIDDCIQFVHEGCHNNLLSCKVRAIHDGDGIVRDVTEDIARLMMDNFLTGYVDFSCDWPRWADPMGLKMADYGFWVEPDYDPNDDL